ncbi:EscU/YscU/HrcU family type III secretion system export apparatus switch protein [Fusibacter sp. JL216-2]|uniref:EscU/YscU/HrcU family type III secretion system export apparatus switch protein n=1 Tax=Fusibacter sp. JL216-2 TaxID=3071453 RepID=UPI003D340DC6
MAKKRNDGLQDKVDSNEQANQRKVATALKYNRGVDDVPKLVAKGLGLVAENIVKTGEEHDIPVYKDERLSKQLYNLALGEEIPPELYEIVAEVLVFIAKMDNKV